MLIHNEDITMCRHISEYGLTLVKDGDGILTHCNAGPLATSRYGTAIGPTSTIDMDCPTGADIKIEQRDPDEIRSMWYREPMTLPEVKCYNPAFDVTDHELLTAIVTDRRIVYPPFDVNLKKLMVAAE